MYTIDRLLRVSRGQESPQSTIDHPLEHLVACHGRIEERLGTLERAGAHMEADPAEALDAIASCFRYFDTSGVFHTADEEESVFPRLRGRLSPNELAEIERLERDHRQADALYAELKKAVADLRQDPHSAEALERYRGIVREFATLYRMHIEFENRELIRVARRDLSAAELAAISDEMRTRRK